MTSLSRDVRTHKYIDSDRIMSKSVATRRLGTKPPPPPPASPAGIENALSIHVGYPVAASPASPLRVSTVLFYGSGVGGWRCSASVVNARTGLARGALRVLRIPGCGCFRPCPPEGQTASRSGAGDPLKESFAGGQPRASSRIQRDVDVLDLGI